ncbi:MAG: Holliday junction resolvase RuvX [Gemmatimonadota bacterium]|mgnify:FL=1
MAIPTQGRVLAVDWGELRIGLANSDELQLIATPLDTLVRRRGKRFPMPSFLAHCTQLSPVGLVVGYPLDEEGEEGASGLAARELSELLAHRTQLPVELWDERMSTVEALDSIRHQGGRTRGRREEVDAIAATVVLQGWLEARRQEAR